MLALQIQTTVSYSDAFPKPYNPQGGLSSSLSFVFELKGRLDAGNRHQAQASLCRLIDHSSLWPLALISKVMKGIACRRVYHI
jgi:hypothetical protein